LAPGREPDSYFRGAVARPEPGLVKQAGARRHLPCTIIPERQERSARNQRTTSRLPTCVHISSVSQNPASLTAPSRIFPQISGNAMFRRSMQIKLSAGQKSCEFA